MSVDSSGDHPPSRRNSITHLLEKNQHLAQSLEDEQQQVRHLESVIRDYQLKLDNALLEQSQLEQDIFERDRKNHALNTELKGCKIQRNELQSNLSQEVVNYVNEKQRWMDKEAQLGDQIFSLESRLKQSESETHNLEYENHKLQQQLLNNDMLFPRPDLPSPLSSTFSFRRPVSPSTTSVRSMPVSATTIAPSMTSNKAPNRAREEMEMVKTQLETVTREYSMRFDKIKKDISELQTINTRLMEENDNFQMLLAEKTIMGGFSLEDELRSAQNNEKDSDSELSDITSSPSPKTPVSSDSYISEGINQDPSPKTRAMYHLQYETETLKNQNTALRLSLERLVNRLLEYKDFERNLEDRGKVHERSISAFQDRFWGSGSSPTLDKLDVPRQRSSRSSKSSSIYQMQFPYGNGLGLRSQKSTSSTAWSSLIFNSPVSTSPKTRIISLGIDQDSAYPSPSMDGSSVMSSPGISEEVKTIVEKTLLSPHSSNESLVLSRPKLVGQKKLKPLELHQAEERPSGWSLY